MEHELHGEEAGQHLYEEEHDGIPPITYDEEEDDMGDGPVHLQDYPPKPRGRGRPKGSVTVNRTKGRKKAAKAKSKADMEPPMTEMDMRSHTPPAPLPPPLPSQPLPPPLPAQVPLGIHTDDAGVETVLDRDARLALHRDIEQKRRRLINDAIQTLQELLPPAVAHGEHPYASSAPPKNKVDTLSRVAIYIQQLKDGYNQLKEENRHLRERLAAASDTA